LVPHALICCSWNVTSNGQILALYDAYDVAEMLEIVNGDLCEGRQASDIQYDYNC